MARRAWAAAWALAWWGWVAGCGSSAPSGAGGDPAPPVAAQPEPPAAPAPPEAPPPAPPVTPPPPPPPPVTPGPPGPPQAEPGPWPTDALKDYSAAYALGAGVQSVGVDAGYNLWLLRGDSIGVLRPGDTQPTWTRGVGQAAPGFGDDKLALGSTVICGGEAGRAYVGYRARTLKRNIPDRPHAYVPAPGEPYYTPERYAQYQQGDLDAVRLQPDGAVQLEEHLWRSAGTSAPKLQLGIRNTNDFHYDEDRTVLSCTRVMRGPNKGDLYIGTNHGVTRIQGLVYNSHRHPGWYRLSPREGGGYDESLMLGQCFGLAIGQDHDEVLIANDWIVGIVKPGSSPLAEWDTDMTWSGPAPWKYKGYNAALNDMPTEDWWKAIAQTRDGSYWVGSSTHGLWRMTSPVRATATYTRFTALPSSDVRALAATDDGALYIGTEGQGLWRLEPDGTSLARVAEVKGQRVLQLLYDPTVSPSMLYALTDTGLTVLRGP